MNALVTTTQDGKRVVTLDRLCTGHENAGENVTADIKCEVFHKGIGWMIEYYCLPCAIELGYKDGGEYWDNPQQDNEHENRTSWTVTAPRWQRD